MFPRLLSRDMREQEETARLEASARLGEGQHDPAAPCSRPSLWEGCSSGRRSSRDTASVPEAGRQGGNCGQFGTPSIQFIVTAVECFAVCTC